MEENEVLFLLEFFRNFLLVAGLLLVAFFVLVAFFWLLDKVLGFFQLLLKLKYGVAYISIIVFLMICLLAAFGLTFGDTIFPISKFLPNGRLS